MPTIAPPITKHRAPAGCIAPPPGAAAPPPYAFRPAGDLVNGPTIATVDRVGRWRVRLVFRAKGFTTGITNFADLRSTANAIATTLMPTNSFESDLAVSVGLPETTNGVTETWFTITGTLVVQRICPRTALDRTLAEAFFRVTSIRAPSMGTSSLSGMTNLGAELTAALARPNACTGAVVATSAIPQACDRLEYIAPLAESHDFPAMTFLGSSQAPEAPPPGTLAVTRITNEVVLRATPTVERVGQRFNAGVTVAILSEPVLSQGDVRVVRARVLDSGTDGYLAVRASDLALVMNEARRATGTGAASASTGTAAAQAVTASLIRNLSTAAALCTISARQVFYLRPTQTFATAGSQTFAAGTSVEILSGVLAVQGALSLVRGRVRSSNQNLEGFLGLNAAEVALCPAIRTAAATTRPVTPSTSAQTTPTATAPATGGGALTVTGATAPTGTTATSTAAQGSVPAQTTTPAPVPPPIAQSLVPRAPTAPSPAANVSGSGISGKAVLGGLAVLSLLGLGAYAISRSESK